MENIVIKAQEVFAIRDFPLTNSVLMALAASVTLILFAIVFRKNIKVMPGKMQAAVELGVEGFLNIMEAALGSASLARKYFPLIATIFIFIAVSNVLGGLPGVGSLVVHRTGGEVALFRSPAADLNLPLALAVLSVVIANILGMVSAGVFKYATTFFNVTSPLGFFVGLLELLMEFSRVISLSFRLFGNVFAGEVLLAIVFSLAPYVIPLPFALLELFLGLIQAFIFAMITLVSISLHTQSARE